MITKNPMQLKTYIQKESRRETHFRAACNAELYAGKTAGTYFPFTV